MAKEKINLIHVVLEMGIGGLQRLITDLSLAMDREIFNIEVVCLDELGCFAEVLEAQGIRCTLLRRKDQHLALYPLRLGKLFRERNAHVVHMHPGALIFGVLAARFAGRPITVYTEHGRGYPEPFQRIIEDRISGVLMDQVIAVSKELELYLVDTVKLPAQKICTVINGIKTTDFIPRPKSAALLAELGIPAQAKVLGTVARIDGVKDQITMVKAFAVVRRQIPEARLLLVGDGPNRGEVEECARTLGVAEFLTITGQRSDVPALLNLFDLFLLSSRREGTSVSLLEAMSAGVVPVVTNVGGNPAIVTHEQDGLLVPPQDPQGMADAVLALLNDPLRRERLAEAAARKVHEQFSIESMARQYVDIYFNLLQKRRKFRHLVPQQVAGRA